MAELSKSDATILLASEVEYLTSRLLDALGPDELTLDCGHHWAFDYDREDWYCPDDDALNCTTCWAALQAGALGGGTVEGETS